MKVGQEVNHLRYGNSIIIRLFKHDSSEKLRAVLLNLTTKEGRGRFSFDRNGSLLYCFENNLKLIEIIE